jgi:UDP-3-O-[3-hydroxymyristoyl] glucosamine N-acyltransferase
MTVSALSPRPFPDRRFYALGPPLSLAEAADLAGLDLPSGVDGDRMITGVESLVEAGPDQISFCTGGAHARALAVTRAGVVLLPSALVDLAPSGAVAIPTPFPQAAMAAIAQALHRPRDILAQDPAIHPRAQLEHGVLVGPGVWIGEGAEVGAGTVIGPGAIIGPGVAIGRNCRIGPRVVVGFALLGDRVQVHAGAVIGEPGFGAAPGPKGIVDLPQLGRVILQDGVTVGANACIDRGAFEDTVVGENTKIDNLVQIAHNVRLGRNNLLAAFTGISGSTVVGDGVMFGGRAGVADHISIGSGARIAAAAGIMKDVPAGESWGGSPGRPVKAWLKETALLARLARRRDRG